MAIQFDDVQDIALYSGYHPQAEKLVTPTLLGDAKISAIAQANEAIKSRTDWVKKTMTTASFLERVKNNQEAIINPARLSKEARDLVTLTLKERAQEQKSLEDAHSRIYKFFLRIIGLFQGYGFHTKGEWGLEFAEQMKSSSFKKLEYSVFTALWEGKKVPEEIFNEINALQKESFEKLLEQDIFSLHIGQRFFQTTKFDLFNKLTTEKQKIFIDQLLARDDWFYQLSDIDLSFLSALPKNEIVKKFQDFFDTAPIKLHRDSGSTAKSLLCNGALLAVRGWIEDMKQKKDFQSVEKIRTLFQIEGPYHKLLLGQFLCNNLTRDEIEVLEKCDSNIANLLKMWSKRIPPGHEIRR